MSETNPNGDLISLTADIVSAHVSNNKIATSDVAALIQATYDALARAGAPAPEPTAPQEPAVSIRASVKPDYIVCLEDGKKLKMLKRHLRTAYNMSPEEYRAKWGLPIDYPFVAPNYAEQRRSLAKQIGLGRKPGAAPKAPAKVDKSVVKGLEAARAHLSGDAPAKRGRKSTVPLAEVPKADTEA